MPPRSKTGDYTKPGGPVNVQVWFFYFLGSGGMGGAGTEGCPAACTASVHWIVYIGIGPPSTPIFSAYKHAWHRHVPRPVLPGRAPHPPRATVGLARPYAPSATCHGRSCPAVRPTRHGRRSPVRVPASRIHNNLAPPFPDAGPSTLSFRASEARNLAPAVTLLLHSIQGEMSPLGPCGPSVEMTRQQAVAQSRPYAPAPEIL